MYTLWGNFLVPNFQWYMPPTSSRHMLTAETALWWSHANHSSLSFNVECECCLHKIRATASCPENKEVAEEEHVKIISERQVLQLLYFLNYTEAIVWKIYYHTEHGKRESKSRKYSERFLELFIINFIRSNERYNFIINTYSKCTQYI